MLKKGEAVKGPEGQAVQALRRLLQQVPVIRLLGLEIGPPDTGPDIVAHLEVAGRRHDLFSQVKPSGQPLQIRNAVLDLRRLVEPSAPKATAFLIAPYLSPEARALCREHGVGFLDLEGNAHLAFGSVFIERQVASKPAAERRELKSLFKPRSAQVLRLLLRDPHRAWRVTELAQVAGVSLGHVSNVRQGLLDREWGRISGDGLFLSEPDTLLDAWRAAYEPPAGKNLELYTILHGGAFEDAARRVLGSDGERGLAVFASFSAAHWLAPYGRTGKHYFHADEAGLERLQKALKLSTVSKGENVVVLLLKDNGLFRDAVEKAPGAFCTSPVQTYLDLAIAGERGKEAADHLRQELMSWPK